VGRVICILGLASFAPNALQASDTGEAPSDLPQLAKEVSEKARMWRRDAWLVKIEVKKEHGSQPADGYGLSFYFFSPADHAGLVLSRGPLQGEDEVAPYEVDQSKTFVPIPDFTVDLPQALITAQKAGLRGPLEEATLAVRTPPAKLPVLVWSIRSNGEPSGPIHVDAFTGAHLTSSRLADPRVDADPTIDSAGRSLKEALLRPSPALPQGTTPWMDFVVIPILNARNVFECNALGGQWRLSVCLP